MCCGEGTLDTYQRVYIVYTYISSPASHPSLSSHFETTAADVLSLYQRITGKELDLTISADSTNPDDY